jgi:hypothetical protein
MDVLSDINSSNFLAPELEKAASRRVYADFQYSWSKRTMLALVDSSQTTQRTVQRQLSMSENSSCASCDLNSETSTECTTPTSTYQTQENLVFRRKQSIKRTYAFNELIDTERVYVNDLNVMIEVQLIRNMSTRSGEVELFYSCFKTNSLSDLLQRYAKTKMDFTGRCTNYYKKCERNPKSSYLTIEKVGSLLTKLSLGEHIQSILPACRCLCYNGLSSLNNK